MYNYQIPLTSGLIVDNFAGGGGASTGIERALGRPVNIAINHNAKALAMHEANHPLTKHYCEDVWEVDPRQVCAGRSVDLAWFSPDCKHFSKAKGGALVDRKIRGLAWVALRWAATVKPRVIILENVEEFVTWGPVLKDGKPCPRRKGQEFKAFVNALKRQGYRVEWNNIKACDFGAPTIRKRLFLIARCDGLPIVWPHPTHGKGLLPYRTAGECMDWTDLGTSIFERKRPLVENTMRRIAKGVQKYVIDAQKPFIVPVCHGEAKGQEPRTHDIDAPLPTITGKGKHALIVPVLVGAGGPSRAGEPKPCSQPIGTILKKNNNALVTAFLVKHFGGFYQGCGSAMTDPAPTILSSGRNNQTQLVTAHVMKLRGTNIGHGFDEPLHTITSSGTHHAQVCTFLTKYLGPGRNLGQVTIAGDQWQIVDIHMRMLKKRELFNAQGFEGDYIIDPIFNGKTLTDTDAKMMVGNSVSPHPAAALVAANCAFLDLSQGQTVAVMA